MCAIMLAGAVADFAVAAGVAIKQIGDVREKRKTRG